MPSTVATVYVYVSEFERYFSSLEATYIAFLPSASLYRLDTVFIIYMRKVAHIQGGIDLNGEEIRNGRREAIET